MSIRRLLRHRVTIRRTADTAGADTTDWGQEPQASTDAAVGVPALVQDIMGREVAVPGGGGPVGITAMVMFEPTADVRRGDTLLLTTPANGRVLEVHAVKDNSGQGKLLQVDCTETKP